MSFEAVTIIYLVGALLSFVLTLHNAALSNAKITVRDLAFGTAFAIASWGFLLLYANQYKALIISKISKIGSITLISFKEK